VRVARVLVVHPHRIAAEAVARRLDAEDGMRTVEIAPNEAAAMNAVRSLGPDVVVVHSDPEHRAALRFITALAEREPPVAVVALLTTDDADDAVRAVRAGAVGVVTNDSSASELAGAVAAVCSGRGWLAPHIVGAVLVALRASSPAPNEYDKRLSRLTEREREILAGLIAGRDRATIAQDLLVSVGTVRTHTRNILAKLEVHSSLEAVSVALRCSSIPSTHANGQRQPTGRSPSRAPVTTS
jgi:NarL family two-component system response regulator LiaR